jgi:hypothetical protein
MNFREVVDLLAPILVGKARLELHAVIFGELGRKANESGAVKRRSIYPPGEVVGGHRVPFYECETDDGNPIGVRIRVPFELLAKDVGVDFLINELQGRQLNERPERLEKRVHPIDDRRSGIENEAAAGPEPRQLCRTIRSPSSMPSSPPPCR